MSLLAGTQPAYGSQKEQLQRSQTSSSLATACGLVAVSAVGALALTVTQQAPSTTGLFVSPSVNGRASAQVATGVAAQARLEGASAAGAESASAQPGADNAGRFFGWASVAALALGGGALALKELVAPTKQKRYAMMAVEPQELPGKAPWGYFDPWNLSELKKTPSIAYDRECELKHGRVAMLAALGFPFAEGFHPLFGGNIDVPSFRAFQETPLEPYWPFVLMIAAWLEVKSISSFENPLSKEGNLWTLKEDHVPGDLGFDPLKLYPKSEEGKLKMQEKELNNGRLAMIGIAGMVVQELINGQKLW